MPFPRIPSLAFRRIRPLTRILPVIALFFSGCAALRLAAPRGQPDAAMLTGRVYSLSELRGLIPTSYFGDDSYAEVNSSWLRAWHLEYRATLWRLGVTRWDPKFDCNRLADFYSGLAQAHFFRANFHSKTPAQALALGPFWYVRHDNGSRHAIIQAITERGRMFIDPLTGQELELTPTEQESAFLQVF